MAQLRICDRCAHPVDGPIDATKLRNVVIPAESPSTQKVNAPFECQIAVASPNDLCDLCLVSALVELVIAKLGPVLTPELIAAIGARAKAQRPPVKADAAVALIADAPLLEEKG
jgi:hypothetical protein